MIGVPVDNIVERGSTCLSVPRCLSDCAPGQAVDRAWCCAPRDSCTATEGTRNTRTHGPTHARMGGIGGLRVQRGGAYIGPADGRFMALGRRDWDVRSVVPRQRVDAALHVLQYKSL